MFLPTGLCRVGSQKEGGVGTWSGVGNSQVSLLGDATAYHKQKMPYTVYIGIMYNCQTSKPIPLAKVIFGHTH